MQRRIWIMNADGKQARQLTSDSQYRDEDPIWSKDGRYILFGRMDEQNEISVWSINTDNGALQEIVSDLSGPGPKRPGQWFGFYGHFPWGYYFSWYGE